MGSFIKFSSGAKNPFQFIRNLIYIHYRGEAVVEKVSKVRVSFVQTLSSNKASYPGREADCRTCCTSAQNLQYREILSRRLLL